MEFSSSLFLPSIFPRRSIAKSTDYLQQPPSSTSSPGTGERGEAGEKGGCKDGGEKGIGGGLRIGWMCGRIGGREQLFDSIMASARWEQYSRAETVDTEGISRFMTEEKRVGKRERSSGRIVARPAARRATPGSTVDQIATRRGLARCS